MPRNNQIRTHVAKPTVIIMMSPIMLGFALLSTLVTSAILAALTPLPFIIWVLASAATFGGFSIVVSLLNPHIDIWLMHTAMRFCNSVGWRWTGYPRLVTKNYWPFGNARFHP